MSHQSVLYKTQRNPNKNRKEFRDVSESSEDEDGGQLSNFKVYRWYLPWYLSSMRCSALTLLSCYHSRFRRMTSSFITVYLVYCGLQRERFNDSIHNIELSLKEREWILIHRMLMEQ